MGVYPVAVPVQCGVVTSSFSMVGLRSPDSWRRCDIGIGISSLLHEWVEK